MIVDTRIQHGRLPLPLEVSAYAEERWALLERVLNGPQLKRSSRLRDLLLYIGKKSIREHARDLREQDIGVAVFARSPAYDTGQDNIVRVNVTELRKRIETYFVHEGAAEVLRFEIPRGSYMLEFVPNGGAESVAQELAVNSSGTISGPDPAVVTSQSDTTRESDTARVQPGTNAARDAARHGILTASLALLLLLVAGWVGWLLHRNAQLRSALEPWQSQPNLKLFWSPFLSAGRPLAVVLGDTSLSLAEDIRQRAVPLNEYLSLNSEHYVDDPRLSADLNKTLSLLLARNNGSFSDFRVARRILSISNAGNAIQLRSAREFSPELLKTCRVILVGSRTSNPWVDLFTPALDFQIGSAPDKSMAFVENLRPHTGEAARYEVSSNSSNTAGYSVIALVPSLKGGDDVLLIAGTDSQATEAAGEFVTNEDSLNDLRKRLGNSGFPRFQLLLRTSKLRGVPLNAQLVALHLSQR